MRFIYQFPIHIVAFGLPWLFFLSSKAIAQDDAAIRMIADNVIITAENLGGRYPTSLADLRAFDLDSFVKVGAGSPLGALGDRYGFPDNELVLPGKGRVLVMALKPHRGEPDAEYGRSDMEVSLAYHDRAYGLSRVARLSEAAAAALLAANPSVRLLPMGTKTVRPQSQDVILNEDEKRLQERFIRGEIHITALEESRDARQREIAEFGPDPKKTQPIPNVARSSSNTSPPLSSEGIAPSPLKWPLLAVATLAVLGLGWRFLRRR